MQENIVRLEEKLKHCEHRITCVEDQHGTLSMDVADIKKIMAQIKNWFVGGVVVIILQQVGLIGFLKKVVGL